MRRLDIVYIISLCRSLFRSCLCPALSFIDFTIKFISAKLMTKYFIAFITLWISPISISNWLLLIRRKVTLNPENSVHISDLFFESGRVGIQTQATWLQSLLPPVMLRPRTKDQVT